MKTLSEALFNKRNLQNPDYYQFIDRHLIVLFDFLYKNELTSYIISSIHNPIDLNASSVILSPPDLDNIKKIISVVSKSNDISIANELKNIDDVEIRNIIERQKFFIFFIEGRKSNHNLDYGIWIDRNGKNRYYDNIKIKEIKVLNDIKSVDDLEI